MAIDPAHTADELTAIGEMEHSQVKGKRLETLMQSLFSQVPGFTFEYSNVQNFFKTEELDLMFSNADYNFLDDPLLIECKSSGAPVDGKSVSYFATTLRHRGCRNGVLVALNGVTGTPLKHTAGFFHQTAALIEGVRVLIVTAEDLKSLTSGEEIVRLLKRVQLGLVRQQVQAIEDSGV
jgi:hypothetical protein